MVAAILETSENPGPALAGPRETQERFPKAGPKNRISVFARVLGLRDYGDSAFY